MVKCPNCGSTAQVRIIGTSYFHRNHRLFECGCGESFVAPDEDLIDAYWKGVIQEFKELSAEQKEIILQKLS